MYWSRQYLSIEDFNFQFGISFGTLVLILQEIIIENCKRADKRRAKTLHAINGKYEGESVCAEERERNAVNAHAETPTQNSTVASTDNAQEKAEQKIQIVNGFMYSRRIK